MVGHREHWQLRRLYNDKRWWVGVAIRTVHAHYQNVVADGCALGWENLPINKIHNVALRSSSLNEWRWKCLERSSRVKFSNHQIGMNQSGLQV